MFIGGGLFDGALEDQLKPERSSILAGLELTTLRRLGRSEVMRAIQDSEEYPSRLATPGPGAHQLTMLRFDVYNLYTLMR